MPMQITWQLIAGLGAVVAIIVIVAILLRAKPKRTPVLPRQMSRGPASLRFTCAGCAAQFTHTKRTVAAWEKGMRRFFCNACHTKWRDTRPPQPAPQSDPAPPARQPAIAGTAATRAPTASTPSRTFGAQPMRASAGNGCLGVMALLIAVPVAIVIVVAHYV